MSGIIMPEKGKPTARCTGGNGGNPDESKSVFVTLPETIVTLHDNNGADHYLSAELVMVVASDKEAEKNKTSGAAVSKYCS